MRVSEIFVSVEGEGSRQGYLATFVRLHGCALRCSWCDSRYACEGTDYREMAPDEVFARVKELGNRRITLTGGEPLISKEAPALVMRLAESGFEVNIETSGSVDYTALFPEDVRERLGTNLMITADWKCPGSGMEKMMKEQCFTSLRQWDVLKFVVCSREDLERAESVIRKYSPPCQVFLSPVFGRIRMSDIVDFMKERNLQNVRIQAQLHKIIWDPAARGV